MIKHKTASLLLLLGLILGTYKGYVALFEEGATEPRQIFHYKVETLPPADQVALESGIPVRDMDRFAQLMEDFFS